MSKPQNEQEWREKCLELARLGVGPVARRLGNAMTPALEALMAYIDAARAAEAAQHQQEIILLRTARNSANARLAEVEEERDTAEARLAAVEAERDRLKAALQDAVYTIAGWRTGSIGSIGNVHVGSFDVEHLARLRAVLTPQGQSTDGETR